MFFGNDSGLRPKAPPLNMLVAMGIAACFCIGIGVFPGLLYNMLPYAVEFEPYTGAHITESLGILMFTLLAFVLLLKYLNPKNTISIDTDWFYRRGAALFMWLANKPIAQWDQKVITLGDGLILNTLHRLSKHSLTVDTQVVDGTVNGVAKTAMKSGNLLRRLQTGIVSHYALAMAIGLFLVIAVYVLILSEVL